MKLRSSHLLFIALGMVLGIGATVGAAGIRGSSFFSDVPEGAYYDESVGAMFNSGIIKGYADGRFGPDDFVTRGQVAVMMQRLRVELGLADAESESSRSSRSRSSSSSSEEDDASFSVVSSSSVVFSSSSSSSSSSSVASYSLNPYGTIRFTTLTYTGNEKDGTATISIVRTGGNQGTDSVEYELQAGTATTDDYEPATASATFEGKSTSAVFTVNLKNDTLTEGTETIKIVLKNPTNHASLGSPSTADIKIIDDETPTVTSSAAAASSAAPTVGLSALDYIVAEAGGSLTVSATRLGGTAGAVTVAYATVDGSAKSGTDYTGVSGTLSFAAGESTKTLTIAVTDDAKIDGNKTFKITLSNPTGAALGQATSNVIIHDEEAAPFGSGSLKFSRASYDGFESQGKAEIVIQRVGGAQGKATVQYSTTDGTGRAGSDYTAVSGTLIFEIGESAKSFFIPITADAAADSEETVNIRMSSPTGAELGTPSTASMTLY